LVKKYSFLFFLLSKSKTT